MSPQETYIRTVTADILSFVTQWDIFLSYYSLNHYFLEIKKKRERKGENCTIEVLINLEKGLL